MERKGKGKKPSSFYPIVFVRKLKDRIVFTDHTQRTPWKYVSGHFRVSLHQFIRNFQRGREEKPAHSLLTASLRIFKVSTKPGLCHLPAGIWTWAVSHNCHNTRDIGDLGRLCSHSGQTEAGFVLLIGNADMTNSSCKGQQHIGICRYPRNPMHSKLVLIRASDNLGFFKGGSYKHKSCSRLIESTQNFSSTR